MTTKTDSTRPDALMVLAEHRPTETSLAEAWSQARADTALDAALRQLVSPTPIHVRPTLTRATRRWAVLVAAGAAVAAGVFTTSAVFSPQAPAAAAVLIELADRAASQPAIADGTYLHTVIKAEQDNKRAIGSQTQEGGGGDEHSTREVWMDRTGRSWVKLTMDTGDVQYFLFPPGGSSVNNPTPNFIATLPTERDALLDYLREHTHGSSSANEAVFVGVADLLRAGATSPELNRAAISVVATLPEVTTETVQVNGHDVLRVDFVDESIRPGIVASIYFDPQSAQLIGSGQIGPDLDYSAWVLEKEHVNEIPAEVRAKALDDETRGKAKMAAGSGQTS